MSPCQVGPFKSHMGGLGLYSVKMEDMMMEMMEMMDLKERGVDMIEDRREEERINRVLSPGFAGCSRKKIMGIHYWV